VYVGKLIPESNSRNTSKTVKKEKGETILQKERLMHDDGEE